jgi:hypothetical protein
MGAWKISAINGSGVTVNIYCSTDDCSKPESSSAFSDAKGKAAATSK